MKAIPTLLGLCLGLSVAQAQDKIRFTATLTGADEVPPNASTYVGIARLTLTGNSLAYLAGMNSISFLPTASCIEGPAAPGQRGEVLFTLEPYQLRPPLPEEGDPGGFDVSGYFDLTEPQKAELLSGLWWINMASVEYPAGEIRGQIVPLAVPEPQVLALLGFGAAVLLLARLPSHKRWRT